MIFHRFYLRLFVSFSYYPPATKINPEFSTRLGLPFCVKLCRSLVKGNSYCLDLLADILACNPDRFNKLWFAITEKLEVALKNADTCVSATHIVVQASAVDFSEDNEQSILALYPLTTPSEDVLNQLRSILQNNTNSIKYGWSSILSTLSPSLFDETLIPKAFTVYNMIVEHFGTLGKDEWDIIINLLFEYAEQTVEFNISLSALGLLWNIVPFVQRSADYWRRIIRGMLVFFFDSRDVVAKSALTTFFSILTSNVNDFPPELFPFLFDESFIPLLATMNEFGPNQWSTGQSCLQEMCHYACGLLKRGVDLPDRFWTLLFDKQSLLMMSCENEEICVLAFDFFADAFSCKDLKQRSILVPSFSDTVRYFLDHFPKTSLVVSQMGRFIYPSISQTRDIISSNILAAWLKMVDKVIATIDNDSFIHISTQRGINGIVSLFPMTAELELQALKGLVRIGISHSSFVKEGICDAITQIAPCFVPKRTILLMAESEPLFNHSFNEFLATLQFEPTDYEKQFEIMIKLGADSRALSVLPFCSSATRLEFVQLKKSNILVLEELWRRFCDPDSATFNDSVSRNVFPDLLKALVEMVSVMEQNEKELFNLLRFFGAAKSRPKDLGANSKCTSWHLMKMTPILINLVNDERAAIREEAKKLLSKINADLKSVIGDS